MFPVLPSAHFLFRINRGGVSAYLSNYCKQNSKNQPLDSGVKLRFKVCILSNKRYITFLSAVRHTKFKFLIFNY